MKVDVEIKNNFISFKFGLTQTYVITGISNQRSRSLAYIVILFIISVGCKSSKKSESTNSAARVAVETARSFVGTPYKYGGTSRAGMDCSGLLVVSFRAAGIQLPRTSIDQSKYGREVEIHDLKPGDLVFFAAGRRRKKITHVGLITEVRGKNHVKFIHSSTKLGVVENELFSDYYRKIFIKAIRPF